MIRRTRAQILITFSRNVVPKARLELARCYQRGILNPLRLPFRHLGTGKSLAKAATDVQCPNRVFCSVFAPCDAAALDPTRAAWCLAVNQGNERRNDEEPL